MLKNLVFYSVLFTLLFEACKTTKNLNTGTPPVRSQKEIFDALQTRNLNFTWFAATAAASFDSPELGGSGTVVLRIKKNELIWMQGKKFGIEGFRGIINKDSFYMVNRLEKNYYAEKNNTIEKSFGLELGFEDLQQLLVGNIFLPELNEVNKYTQKDKDCILTTNNSSYNIVYVLNAFDLTLYNVSITDRQGRKINVNFEDYKKLGKHLIPYTRSMTFQPLGEPSSFLNIKIDELEINKEKSMNFSLPSHYERARF